MSNFTKKHNNCVFFCKETESSFFNEGKNHNNDVFYLTLNPDLVFSWHRYLFAKNHIVFFLELDKLTMIRFFIVIIFVFIILKLAIKTAILVPYDVIAQTFESNCPCCGSQGSKTFIQNYTVNELYVSAKSEVHQMKISQI